MIRSCIFTDEVAPEFEEAVRLSAEAGAQGLELRNKLFGKSIVQIDDMDVRRIRDVCRTHGVEVAVLGSPVGKCSLDDPEEQRRHQDYFRRMAELAHAFETPIIRGFALWRPNRDRATDHLRPNLEAHLAQIVDFLAPIVEHAERENVRLCLETEGATLVGTCAEARRVMDALGNSPALGVTWDVNNGLACGENPYPDGYRLIHDRIYHVHVKPNAQQSLATVGESDLTYAEVLAVLKAAGYDAWASIEHWGAPEQMLKGLRELVPLLEVVNR